MNLKINFHQLDSSESIKAIVEKKSAKIKKFFDRTIDLEWFLEANKEGHSAKVALSSQGIHINAEAKTNDLYKAIDDVIGKMEAQIKKQRSKITSPKHSKAEHYEDF